MSYDIPITLVSLLIAGLVSGFALYTVSHGIEVLRQVKSSPTLKCIPIVMMTSSDLDRDIIESYELGANAYAVKPVEMDKFLEAVRQIAAFWVVLNRPKPG